MKTAISIDNQLFAAAENYTSAYGLSRSGLYSAAIREYIQNHMPDFVTEKLNNYYADHESKIDDGLKMAAYDLFNREDW